jgi:hypothetical protein
MERQHNRRQAERTRLAHGLLQNLLMPAMNAVEHADSDSRVAQRRF